MSGWGLRVRSNSAALLNTLRAYFQHAVRPPATIDAEVHAYESADIDLKLPFVDWRREEGKTGRKDACFDLADGRIVRKVRTGMTFLQSSEARIAIGPCLANDNQVINFINAQYMNCLQQEGWQICHAAGAVRGGRALAMAGLSGGGKSTLMLTLLDAPDVAFLTNDRLFVRQREGRAVAAGIPKMPRINPGTALNNARLENLVPEPRRDELNRMKTGELWDVEEKYDVDVTAVYGDNRIVDRAPLAGFLILNWSRESRDPCRIEPVDIGQRRDLLAAVMKSPGPFYQDASGKMLVDGTPLDSAAYLRAFAAVPFYEATGMIDFSTAADRCLADLLPAR